MIYFARLESGSIKIGHTDDINSRLQTLRSHYEGEVAILATIPGDRDREREIHDQFAEHRMGRTEQFRPAYEVLAFIDLPLLASPNPETIELTKWKESRYGPAKVDVQALTLAKKAAAMLDKTLADYLSDLVFEHAPHDIQAGAARLAPRSPRKEKWRSSQSLVRSRPTPRPSARCASCA